MADGHTNKHRFDHYKYQNSCNFNRNCELLEIENIQIPKYIILHADGVRRPRFEYKQEASLSRRMTRLGVYGGVPILLQTGRYT